MKTSNPNSLIIPATICLALMSGCISTTTGSVTEPVRNEEDAAQLNYELGARYYNSGNYEIARDRLLLAAELNPRLAVVHTTLGLTYEALDNPRLAKASYETAIRVAPRDFDIQNAYAVFLCQQEEFLQAQKFFEKAASHPENDNAEVTLTNAGVCMVQRSEVELAESNFRAALKHKANHAEALLQLCLLEFKQENYLSSRAFLQRWMADNVPTAGILYLASRIEDMLGNDRGRTEFEDRLIREFPSSTEARRVLGAGQ